MGNLSSRELAGGWRKDDRVRARDDLGPQHAVRRGDLGTVLGPCGDSSLEDAAQRVLVKFDGGKGEINVVGLMRLESGLAGGWCAGDRVRVLDDYDPGNGDGSYPTQDMTRMGDVGVVLGPACENWADSAQKARCVQVDFGGYKGKVDVLGEEHLEHEKLPGGWRKGDSVRARVFDHQLNDSWEVGMVLGPWSNRSRWDWTHCVGVVFARHLATYDFPYWRLARASPEQLLADMLATERLRREASATSFYFLKASKIRDCSLEKLPKLQDVKRLYPDWIIKKPIDITSSLLGDYRENSLGVSHRWTKCDEPDPNGVQLAALKRYLRDHPEIKHVWFDYSSLPQKPRTPEEDAEFAAMLFNVNAIYIGMKVLVLLDKSSLSRFWPLMEAWMSMQDVSISGLAKTCKKKQRYTVVPLHRATKAHVRELEEEWAGRSAREAHGILSSEDVTVTNMSDKDTLLPKVLQFNEAVIDLLRAHEPISSALSQLARATAAQDASALEAALSVAERAGVAPATMSMGRWVLATLLRRL